MRSWLAFSRLPRWRWAPRGGAPHAAARIRLAVSMENCAIGVCRLTLYLLNAGRRIVSTERRTAQSKNGPQDTVIAGIDAVSAGTH